MRENSIVRKYRNVGQKLPSRAMLRKIAKATQLVRRLPPVHQTSKQLADRTWHCPTCHKTLGQLRAKGKVIDNDGYLQCADCRADIDNASEKPRKLTKEGLV